MSEPDQGVETPTRPLRSCKQWPELFFETLAETSNVAAAAKRARITQSYIYKQRRRDPEFARRWLLALGEGYDNLEMEVLERLRNGRNADGDGNKFDNAVAIRLLIAHRADAARARALLDDDDEQSVLDSINAMIDDMRERAVANADFSGDQGNSSGDQGRSHSDAG